jgi:O-antigen ligase
MALEDQTMGGEEEFGRLARYARALSLALLVVTLAWAPFPLGSALSWCAPVLAILLAISWVFWGISTLTIPGTAASLRLVAVPAVLVLLVFAWTIVQTLPVVPAHWVHPVWPMAADALARPVRGVVSIDPWRTWSDCLKLAVGCAACWLAFVQARRSQAAGVLLNAVIAVTAFYAVYGFVLAATGHSQVGLVYGLPLRAGHVTGPFMLHNSHATFCGLGMLAALARFADLAGESVVMQRGPRQFALTAIHFVFGRGAVLLIATLLLFAALLASASRAGFVATMLGTLTMAVLAAIRMRRSRRGLWGLGALALVLATILGTLLSSAGLLGQGLSELAAMGGTDPMRLVLWDASRRMIADSPWLGLGLGTFQDAYPLYAVKVLPFVMDKAHCDYLEFAAGLGLPAAIVWWLAIAWLAVMCAVAALYRRRNAVFALLAASATVLVAVHSAVDFSLQLPAVAVLYAIILGAGVGQSQRTRDRLAGD